MVVVVTCMLVANGDDQLTTAKVEDPEAFSYQLDFNWVAIPWASPTLAESPSAGDNSRPALFA